jgi:hypothetical protein
MNSSKLLMVLGALAAPVAAEAAVPIPIASYDMPNGSGQASGGSFNYWDKAYNGIGSTTVDGAPLSGGTGDLSDGVVASDIWSNVESVAGDGPYVGWIASRTPVPTIDFYLLPNAGPGYWMVTGIAVHMDNSHKGAVYAPASIFVNGFETSFTPPAIGSIGWVNLSGFGPLTSVNPITMELVYALPTWIFLSEVQFTGVWVPDPGNRVPEPGTWAMMIAGFGLVGAGLRLRRPLATS